MNKLLLGSFLAVSMLMVSGCSVKTANSSTTSSTCIGCEGLPDCVPGPYGDCLPKTKK
ncbi:MAG: hypothetical protein K0U47_06035 [Epsilonproteobacteria bacterium]|nr:hypothetical protein [Campylobacterota bacterium]